MNASKFPKPLGYLFMVQLAALISVLFFTIDEIWDGITYVICIQVVGVALGGACLAGPSAKGKQKEMLNILGVVMMVPIITFLIPYLFADEFVNWDQSNIRIFSMLTFYATAFPMLFFGLFVLREGWGANPKSARVLFFMNLFFLLGGDRETGDRPGRRKWRPVGGDSIRRDHGDADSSSVADSRGMALAISRLRFGGFSRPRRAGYVAGIVQGVLRFGRAPERSRAIPFARQGAAGRIAFTGWSVVHCVEYVRADRSFPYQYGLDPEREPR